MNELLTRAATIEPGGIIDAEARRVRLSFSSEAPYLRSQIFDDPWLEILGHKPGEVDLSRLETGTAPLLYNHALHGRENHIGVVERAWIDKGKGYAEVRFSTRPDVEGIWADVVAGILTNVSVGYSILERKLTKSNTDGPDEYRVTKWTPAEISMVPLPADSTVGVGRSHELHPQFSGDTAMTQQTEELTERARQGDIRALVRKMNLSDTLAETLVAEGKTIEQARAAVIDALADKSDTVQINPHHRSESGDAGRMASFAEDAAAAMMVRSGMRLPKLSQGAAELVKYPLTGLAEQFLRVRGFNTSGMNQTRIVEKALETRYGLHSTSDFANLLGNTAGKALRQGYMEEPASHALWTAEIEVPDFKQQTLVQLSEAPELELVAEADEYTHGTFGDAAETFQIAKYGRLFHITREALINDDLSGFTRLPEAFGRSARRKESDLVYNILIGNPTLADGVALFHATHANVSTGALSVEALSVARSLMRLQKNLSGAPINIRPAYLIVPAALETEAEQLLASLVDPAQTNDTANPEFVRGLKLVVDARLDDNPTPMYYLAAAPTQVDTITRAYLQGSERPHYETREGWEIDGLQVKARLEVAAVPVDYRGLVQVTLP
jgi:hypothetical protein